MERAILNRAIDLIMNDKIVCLNFGAVSGFVYHAKSQTARDQVADFKQYDESARATQYGALVTTQASFAELVDATTTPLFFQKLIQARRVPEGIHFRIQAKSPNPPPGSYSEEVEPDDSLAKYIQPVVFEQMLPDLGYMLGVLAAVGINYVVATSGNIHGESELKTYGEQGWDIAKRHGLLYLQVAPDPSKPYPPGSFSGVRIRPTGLSLFRYGHYHYEILRARLKLTRDEFPVEPNAKQQTYEYPELSNAMIAALCALPIDQHLTELYRLSEQLKKSKLTESATKKE